MSQINPYTSTKLVYIGIKWFNIEDRNKHYYKYFKMEK